MHGRTLAWCVGIVVAALLLPSLAIDHHPAAAEWLATFRPGTFHHAEGLLRSTPRGEREIVVLGSSVAVTNVIDGALARRTGRPVLNAGMMGAPVCVSSMLASEIAARRPETVVFVLAAMDLERCVPNRPAFDLDIAWRALGPLELIRDERWIAGALGEVSALVRHREALQTLEDDEGRGWAWHPRYGGPFDPERMERHIATRTQRLRGRSLDGDTPSVRALARFAERLPDTEIVLVPAPTRPEVVEAVCGAQGTAWLPAHVARLEAVAADIGGRVVGPDVLGEFVSTDLNDATHLGASGQPRFTFALADALR